MRLHARLASIAAWTIALLAAPTPALAQDGCLADLNDDGLVNGTDLAIVLGGWGPCPVNTTFVGGVVKAGGSPVVGATVTTDLGGETVSGDGGIFLLQIELPSVIETVTLSATAEINGVGFEGTKTVSPVTVGGNNLVGLIEVSSGGCDAGFAWTTGPNDAQFNGLVRCVVECDLGAGPRLFVGGDFTSVNGVPITALAVWDGDTWSQVGGPFSGSTAGLPTSVRAMLVHDNGAGPALYVGGSFTQIDSLPAVALARWDGQSWSTTGDYSVGSSARVNSLTTWEPTIASRGIAVGGLQLSVPNSGSDKTPLLYWHDNNGISSVVSMQGEVHSVISLDHRLYLGGRMSAASNVWLGLGVVTRQPTTYHLQLAGPQLTSNELVTSVIAGTDTSFPNLYVGGRFSTLDSNGALATNIYQWLEDPKMGWRWISVGGGTNSEVSCLFGAESPDGFRLFAGGEFTQAGNTVAFRIAEWNGQFWSPLGGGLDGPPLGLFSTADSLMVGGGFSVAGSTPAAGLAQWGCNAP